MTRTSDDNASGDAAPAAAYDDFRRDQRRMMSTGVLASGLAHEINNVLGGILMAAQYARSVMDRNDARPIIEKSLADIEADAQRCSEVVRDLLRFARSERLEHRPCDAHELIESAIAIARKQAPRGTRIELDPDAPEGSLRASATELRQAIAGLLAQSLLWARSEVTVTTQAPNGDDAFRIVVRNDGEVMSAAAIEEMFDPFGDGAASLIGTAPELSLAHAIVSDHGGTIDVASSGIGGPVVTLRLPAFAETEEH